MGGLRGSLALAAVTVLGCASVPLTMSVPASPSPPSASAQRPPIGAATSTSARRAPVAELTAPSWGSIYSRYFAPGTEGDCGRSRACHAETMVDATSAYTWLAQRGYRRTVAARQPNEFVPAMVWRQHAPARNGERRGNPRSRGMGRRRRAERRLSDVQHLRATAPSAPIAVGTPASSA